MISIIIILYNSQKYIKKCLDSIETNFPDKNEYEVILFNNNSYEKYSNIISDNYKVINSLTNKGYSKALNECILKSKGEYILTINPDTILFNDTIPMLRNTFNNITKVGVVGAKVLNENMSFQLSSRRAFPTSIMIVKRYMYKASLLNENFYNYTHKDMNVLQEVDSVSGACMMFTKKIYKLLSGYDDHFFLYFEDTDFCLRAIKENYKVIYNPKSKIIHYKGASITNKNKLFVWFHFYISMIKFIFKYYYKYKIELFIFLFLLIIAFV